MYFESATLAISELLDLVSRRSGRPLPPSFPTQHHVEALMVNTAEGHAEDDPTKARPPIEDDINAADMPRLADFFRASNNRIYALAAGIDPRVTLLPSRDKWPAGVPSHWLETSPVLAPYVQPWLAPPLPPPQSQAPDLFCVNGRRIPHLLLLGGQKCGTTSFVFQMREEWRIKAAVTSHKEVHYFDKAGANSIEEYAENFPECGPNVLTFDGTPNYVASSSMERNLRQIKEAYGPARLSQTTFAMLLCDPAQRSQSFVYHIGDGDYRSAAAGELGADQAFTGGLYGAQADLIAREFGQLAIIPSAVYYENATLAIGELLELVSRRSGRPLPPSDASQHQERAATRNTAEGHAEDDAAKAHPPLVDDINPSDMPRLADFFRASNNRIYALAAGIDPRVTLLPSRDKWPAGVPSHWLETSEVLSPFVVSIPPAPVLRGSDATFHPGHDYETTSAAAVAMAAAEAAEAEIEAADLEGREDVLHVVPTPAHTTTSAEATVRAAAMAAEAEVEAAAAAAAGAGAAPAARPTHVYTTTSVDAAAVAAAEAAEAAAAVAGVGAASDTRPTHVHVYTTTSADAAAMAAAEAAEAAAAAAAIAAEAAANAAAVARSSLGMAQPLTYRDAAINPFVQWATDPVGAAPAMALPSEEMTATNESQTTMLSFRRPPPPSPVSISFRPPSPAPFLDANFTDGENP